MTKLILIDDMQSINDWQEEVFTKIINNIISAEDGKKKTEKIAVIKIDATALLKMDIEKLLSGDEKQLSDDEKQLSDDEKSAIHTFVKLLPKKEDNIEGKENNDDKDNSVFVIDYRWNNSPESDDKSGLICAKALGEKFSEKNNIKIILVSSKIHEVDIKEENIIWCKRPFFERTDKNTVKPDNGTTTDNDTVVERLEIKDWENSRDETKKQIFAMCRSCYIKYQFIGCVMACCYSFLKKEKEEK